MGCASNRWHLFIKLSLHSFMSCLKGALIEFDERIREKINLL